MKSGLTKEDLYSPGLEGIPVCHSRVGYVDGLKGILEYRGVRIEELAKHSTFEEVSFLLLKGRFPSKEEFSEFQEILRSHRRIKPEVLDIIQSLPKDGHPIDALQTGIAGLGMFHPSRDTKNAELNWSSVCRIISKVPTILAAYERHRMGEDFLLPKDDLSFSANFLYMLSGQKPSEGHARLFDACLILHAEHTLNASTFSARVAGSTLADPFTVVSAAVGTLSGPLHGGANEAVIMMLNELATVDRVRPFMEEKIQKNEKIMGLGHRVYKTKDPRAMILQSMAKELLGDESKNHILKIAEEVENVAAEKLAAKGVYPNVDFYSGIIYSQLGIASDLFTPVFAVARTSGWLAHWLEQLENNRIYRPTQIYDGEHDIPYSGVNS